MKVNKAGDAQLSIEKNDNRVQVVRGVVISGPDIFQKKDIVVDFFKIQTPGGGNCFYYAAVIGMRFLKEKNIGRKQTILGVYGLMDNPSDEAESLALRATAATDKNSINYAIANRFLGYIQTDHDQGDEEKSIAEMLKDGGWADEFAVRVVAKNLEVTICILFKNGGEYRVGEWINPGYQTLYMLLDGGHYTAMIPASAH